jgi:hypothetical protein
MSDVTAKTAFVFGENPLDRTVADMLAARGFDIQPSPDSAGMGSLDLAVAIFPGDLTEHELGTLDEALWIKLAEAPPAEARRFLTIISPALREPGGSVLIVLPNIGMIGVAGLGAQTMASEGIRSLAKAVAKQWRPRDVRLNTAVLSPAQLRAPREALATRIAAIAAAMATDGFIVTATTLIADGEQTSV